MALPTLQCALKDGFGAVVMVREMPEPCTFPSLDSCQKRSLWTPKGIDLAPHSSNWDDQKTNHVCILCKMAACMATKAFLQPSPPVAQACKFFLAVVSSLKPRKTFLLMKGMRLNIIAIPSVVDVPYYNVSALS